MAKKPKKQPLPTTDPKRAVAYVRVSTEDQHLGMDAQRTAIEQWAAREGVAIDSWHLDHGVSGSVDHENRPGLVAALEAMDSSGAGLLVVARRDRLARDAFVSMVVARAIEDKGARVATADGVTNDDTPEGVLMRRIFDAFAEFERMLIKSRTKKALDERKRRGVLLGQPRYGFRRVDAFHHEPNPEEQRVISLVHNLSAKGRSLCEIATELNSRGIAPRHRRRKKTKSKETVETAWHPTTVSRLLQLPPPSAQPGLGTTSSGGASGS